MTPKGTRWALKQTILIFPEVFAAADPPVQDTYRGKNDPGIS